jgi:hypothetical protein
MEARGEYPYWWQRLSSGHEAKSAEEGTGKAPDHGARRRARRSYTGRHRKEGGN